MPTVMGNDWKLYFVPSISKPPILIASGNPMSFDFKATLETLSSIDVQTLVKKDAEYGSSWKKRGGVGAFMMLARKWDRLETQVSQPCLDQKYDIFDAIEGEKAGSNSESVLETIRDLRRYLLLVESEIERRKSVENFGSQSKM